MTSLSIDERLIEEEPGDFAKHNRLGYTISVRELEASLVDGANDSLCLGQRNEAADEGAVLVLEKMSIVVVKEIVS